MTDILPSSFQFLLWTCIYLGSKYAWSWRVRLILFLPLAAFSIWDLLMISNAVPTVAISVQSSIGRPLNIVLQLATLGIILLFLVTAGRHSARGAADADGR
jgi:hypothetical protein